jgi:hypothetical protein
LVDRGAFGRFCWNRALRVYDHEAHMSGFHRCTASSVVAAAAPHLARWAALHIFAHTRF